MAYLLVLMSAEECFEGIRKHEITIKTETVYKYMLLISRKNKLKEHKTFSNNF